MSDIKHHPKCVHNLCTQGDACACCAMVREAVAEAEAKLRAELLQPMVCGHARAHWLFTTECAMCASRVTQWPGEPGVGPQPPRPSLKFGREEAELLKSLHDEVPDDPDEEVYPPYGEARIADAGMVSVQDVLRRVSEIESRLPDGMKDCTIVLKRCDLGHAWLTATNWIDHGCPTCAESRARDEEREACGKLCDRFTVTEIKGHLTRRDLEGVARILAATIRARGQSPDPGRGEDVVL